MLSLSPPKNKRSRRTTRGKKIFCKEQVLIALGKYRRSSDSDADVTVADSASQDSPPVLRSSDDDGFRRLPFQQAVKLKMAEQQKRLQEERARFKYKEGDPLKFSSESDTQDSDDDENKENEDGPNSTQRTSLASNSASGTFRPSRFAISTPNAPSSSRPIPPDFQNISAVISLDTTRMGDRTVNSASTVINLILDPFRASSSSNAECRLPTVDSNKDKSSLEAVSSRNEHDSPITSDGRLSSDVDREDSERTNAYEAAAPSQPVAAPSQPAAAPSQPTAAPPAVSIASIFKFPIPAVRRTSSIPLPSGRGGTTTPSADPIASCSRQSIVTSEQPQSPTDVTMASVAEEEEETERENGKAGVKRSSSSSASSTSFSTPSRSPAPKRLTIAFTPRSGHRSNGSIAMSSVAEESEASGAIDSRGSFIDPLTPILSPRAWSIIRKSRIVREGRQGGEIGEYSCDEGSSAIAQDSPARAGPPPSLAPPHSLDPPLSPVAPPPSFASRLSASGRSPSRLPLPALARRTSAIPQAVINSNTVSPLPPHIQESVDRLSRRQPCTRAHKKSPAIARTTPTPAGTWSTTPIVPTISAFHPHLLVSSSDRSGVAVRVASRLPPRSRLFFDDDHSPMPIHSTQGEALSQLTPTRPFSRHSARQIIESSEESGDDDREWQSEVQQPIPSLAPSLSPSPVHSSARSVASELFTSPDRSTGAYRRHGEEEDGEEEPGEADQHEERASYGGGGSFSHRSLTPSFGQPSSDDELFTTDTPGVRPGTVPSPDEDEEEESLLAAVRNVQVSSKKRKISGRQLAKRKLIAPSPNVIGLRRSKRTRMKPLRGWLGERAVYQISPSGDARLVGVSDVIVRDRFFIKHGVADGGLAVERQKQADRQRRLARQKMAQKRAEAKRRSLRLDHSRGQNLDKTLDSIQTSEDDDSDGDSDR